MANVEILGLTGSGLSPETSGEHREKAILSDRGGADREIGASVGEDALAVQEL